MSVSLDRDQFLYVRLDLAPYDVLSAHNTNTNWYEHALRRHGSRTVVFELRVTVPSHELPARHRSYAGWTSACVPEFSCGTAVEPVVLAHSEDEDPEEQLVVLMSALPWPGSADPDHDHYPTLPQLYNALAQRFIDTDCVPFRKYLAIQLGYEDCPELASPTFVTILPPDIRQVHLHWLCLYMHTSKTAQHERDIRDRARRGEGRLGPHRPRDGGARRDNIQ